MRNKELREEVRRIVMASPEIRREREVADTIDRLMAAARSEGRREMAEAVKEKIAEGFDDTFVTVDDYGVAGVTTHGVDLVLAALDGEGKS